MQGIIVGRASLVPEHSLSECLDTRLGASLSSMYDVISMHLIRDK